MWARKTIESDIFRKKAEYFKIWFYIVLTVAHKTKKGFTRGTGYFSWFREKPFLVGIKETQWHKCINWLKTTKRITTQKTTRGIIITVADYEKYQDADNYKGETKNDITTKQERNKSDMIHKNVKNERMKEKERGSVNAPHTPKQPFQTPTIAEISAYIKEKGYQFDPERFIDFYESKGWYVGKNKMKDWKAAVRNWEWMRKEKDAKSKQEPENDTPIKYDY